MKIKLSISKQFNDELSMECSDIKVENQMLIISNPTINNDSSVEIWIPMNVISFINIIEK